MSESLAADEDFGMEGPTPATRSLGGRSLTSGVNQRAMARNLSRCPTRAKYSPSTNHESPVTNHASLIGVPKTLCVLGWLIGTLERLETRVSHRKQRIGTRSNRYSFHPGSMTLHPPFSAHRSRAALPGAPAARGLGVPETFRVLGRWSGGALPETAERVETRVTHRKQSTAYLSTRDGFDRRSIVTHSPFAAHHAPITIHHSGISSVGSCS
jgi:hypothetical protein